jgi:hypothetical protein
MGPVGPQGPAGPQGPTGPQGPQGAYGTGPAATGGLKVVDAVNQEVGTATEPFGGLLLRRMGNDNVLFLATPNGPVKSAIDVYYLSADCGGAPHVSPSGGVGLAFYAQVNSGTAFFTRNFDLSAAMPVTFLSHEHFEANEDATKLGTRCVNNEPTDAMLGTLTMATDPVLGNPALPWRVK